MLVLSRDVGTEIIINTGREVIRVMVCEASKGRAKIGVSAPRSVDIVRAELIEKSKTPTVDHATKTTF